MSASQCLQVRVLQNQPFTSLGEVYLDARIRTATFYIQNHTFTEHWMKDVLPQT